MLSKRTLLEIIHILENWDAAELGRFALTFDINLPEQPNGLNLSKARKGNIILLALITNNSPGPFSENIQQDSIQYVLDKYVRDNPPESRVSFDFWDSESVDEHPDIDSKFIDSHNHLYNSLKRDGYTITNSQIVPLLPNELINYNVENELTRLLTKFNFNTAKGHLEQAIENHSNGNWAGANGQFRTYMESLLIEITNKLIPSRQSTNIGDAITWLSTPTILNPVLLHQHLNEVPSAGLNFPYVNGLWKRLHPAGSHPGLSDEEDSTFRYHTLIVFTRYLLSRLENRI